jgi:hypothetical protein
MNDIDVVAVVKGEERYVILYNAETRAAALRQLGRWAGDETLSFTWYDAAVASQRIRESDEKPRRFQG